MSEMTYSTRNIDLAAALITSGVPLSDVRSEDGLVCTFVFPEKHGPYVTATAASLYAQGNLLVSGSDVARQRRGLMIAARRANDSYRRDRHAELERERA